MFEPEVQHAWESYYEDYGLGRIMLFIAFYNTFLFFFGIFAYGELVGLSLLPVVVVMIFFFFRRFIVRLKPLSLFLVNLIPMTVAIGFNYYLIGVLDERFGHLQRLDSFFAGVEYWIFGDLVTRYIEELLRPAGMVGSILYDLMMTSYMLYFFLPFIGAYFYWRYLPQEQKYKIGRLCGSMIIFYCLNYILYLTFPVTGPQYYIEEFHYSQLPFTEYGRFLYRLIRENHTTYIDCFPSGHFGMALLVLIWLYRMNHTARYFMYVVVGLILMATLAMRYHYVLDLVAAVPLAFLSFYLGKKLIPSQVHVNYFREGMEDPVHSAKGDAS